MSEIKISVIIPTFNRSQLLMASVQSVLEQTYQNFEIIIIDDASTDDTAEVVQRLMASDARIRYYRQETNQRAPAARNRGLNLSQGTYIQFLDSDDLLLPKKFEDSINIIYSKGEFDAVITQTEIFGEQEGVWGNLPDKHETDMLHKYIEGDLKWSITGPVWNKIFLNKIGGFKEDLLASQEHELHIRALCYSSNFFFLPIPYVRVRIHFDGPSMRKVFYSKQQQISSFKALAYNYKLLIDKQMLTSLREAAIYKKIKMFLRSSIIENNFTLTRLILSFFLGSKCEILYKLKIISLGYFIFMVIIVTGKGKNLFLKVLG